MQLISDKLAEHMSKQVAAITKQVTEKVTEKVTDKVNRLLTLIEASVPHLSSIPTPLPEAPTRGKQSPPIKEKAPTGQKTKGKGKGKKEGMGKQTPPPAPSQQPGPPPPTPKKGTGGTAPPPRRATEKNPPLLPPPPPTQLDAPFSKVVGRKARRNQAYLSRDQQASTKAQSPPAPTKQFPPTKGGEKKKRKRRPPATAAVAITAPKGTYCEVMARAKREIPLGDLGISELKSRRGQTGALILEIGGPDNRDKANRLAKTMADLFAKEEGVKITCPTKMAELRLSGLDPDTVTTEEILSSVVKVGDCSPTDVKVGEIRPNSRRRFTAWVKCPLSAANKIAATGRIAFSAWSTASVALLEQRPLQCFKCLEVGHVRACCPNNNIDRSGACYRCGKEGHPARVCTAPAHCVVCASAGKQASHRMGGPACKPPKKGVRVGKGGGAKAAPAPLPQRQPRPSKTGGSSQAKGGPPATRDTSPQPGPSGIGRTPPATREPPVAKTPPAPRDTSGGNPPPTTRESPPDEGSMETEGEISPLAPKTITAFVRPERMEVCLEEESQPNQ